MERQGINITGVVIKTIAFVHTFNYRKTIFRGKMGNLTDIQQNRIANNFGVIKKEETVFSRTNLITSCIRLKQRQAV